MDVAVGDPLGECHLNGLLVGGGGMSYFAGGGSGHIKHVKTTVQHDTNIKLEVAGPFFEHFQKTEGERIYHDQIDDLILW